MHRRLHLPQYATTTRKMEIQDMFLLGAIKQEPDYKAAGNVKNYIPLFSEKVKHEQDINVSWTLKKEENGEDESYTSPVIKRTRTSSPSLCFPDDDIYLYCEKCQLRYEGCCPEHGPLVYIDNAEVAEGCSKHFSPKVQVADNEDRQGPGGETVKKPGIFEEREEIHSCVQRHLSISKVEYLQVIPDDAHSDSLTDGLSDYNEGVMDGDICVVDPSKDDNKKSRLRIKHTLKDSISQHEEKTADVFDSCSDDVATLPNHNSDQMFTVPEINTDLCVTDIGCGLQSNVGIKKRNKICTEYKPFTCDVCYVELADASSLKRHKKTHKGEKPYKCDVCGVGFAWCSNLIAHKRIHSAEKPYKCEVCGVCFNQRGHLTKHTRIHTGEKPFICDVCDVRFTRADHLKTHKRLHTMEKPYKCDMCELSFAQGGTLIKHKRTHTGERPYVCDVCAVGFTRADHLKLHKRSHTMEKPYKCDMCGLSFSQCGNLFSHIRIHTGENPYKCDVCGVGFTQRGPLKNHKRIHIGEKPYKCDVCGVGFTQRGPLKNHKRIHTGEKP